MQATDKPTKYKQINNGGDIGGRAYRGVKKELVNIGKGEIFL